MAKKGLKVEDLIDAIQHDDRVIEAILLRIENSLTKTIERIVEKYAMKMEKSIDQKLQKLTDEHTQIVASLNKENQLLRARIDDLETYSRLDNLVIQGLDVSLSAGPDNVSEAGPDNVSEAGPDNVSEAEPENVSQAGPANVSQAGPANVSQAGPDNVYQAVLKLFNVQMGLHITDSDIDKAHFIPTKAKSQTCRPILVRFANRKSRDKVLLARKQLKKRPDNSRVYINEHLTLANAAIFSETRKLVKAKKLYSTWTREGKIYCKSTDDPTERPRRVSTLMDLESIETNLKSIYVQS